MCLENKLGPQWQKIVENAGKKKKSIYKFQHIDDNIELTELTRRRN